MFCVCAVVLGNSVVDIESVGGDHPLNRRFIVIVLVICPLAWSRLATKYLLGNIDV